MKQDINSLINIIKNYELDPDNNNDVKQYIPKNIEYMIKESKYEDITNYLEKTWFNNKICDEILPSIKILFKNKIENYELQCAISMLIPKFEYILRVLCQSNKISITNKGKEEKTIGKLLQDDNVKKLFKDNDYYYIKCALLKEGLDIRDKFAHGFDNDLYTLQILEILFIIIIKLT